MKRGMRRGKRVWSLVALLLSTALGLVLTACGGGGGGGGGSHGGVIQPLIVTKLSGTAAEGAPIAGGTVWLKDSQGVIAGTTTHAGGIYSIQDIQMTAPVLLKVTKGNIVYYSVATAEGTANIHPFTDLIIRNWYDVQNVNIDTDIDFSSTVVPPAVPTKQEIDTIESVVKNIISDFLAAKGLDPAQFNLITTDFVAGDTTGFDGVLDVVKVQEDDQGNVAIVAVDPQTADSNTLATITPDTGLVDIDTAKNEINQMLPQLANTINSKRCNLTTADLQDYFATDYLSHGWDTGVFVDEVKYEVLDCNSTGQDNGVNLGLELINIDTYDSQTGELSGKMKMTITSGGVSRWTIFPESFRKVNGQWKATGNGHIGDIELVLKYEKQYIAPSHPLYSTVTWVYRKAFRVEVKDYLGKVASVKVLGPGIDPSLEDVQKICERSDPNLNDCEEDNTVREFKKKLFWARNDGMSPDWNFTPYAGAIYTVLITQMDGSTVSYPITILPAPDDFAYPVFQNLNPGSHSLTFTNGNMVVTGEVYIPSFVKEVGSPWVDLWGGDYSGGNWGNQIGEVDCPWTATPQPGQNNPFRCVIPDNVNGTPVTIANLGEDANGPDLGGVKSAIGWDFVK